MHTGTLKALALQRLNFGVLSCWFNALMAAFKQRKHIHSKHSPCKLHLTICGALDI